MECVSVIDYGERSYFLGIYEECEGDLMDIKEQEGVLIAQIGGLRLTLPMGIIDKLMPLLGQRIAILRTDIKDKAYLVRVLSSDTASTDQTAHHAPSRSLLKGGPR
jgi:hypothetical protein